MRRDTSARWIASAESGERHTPALPPADAEVGDALADLPGRTADETPERPDADLDAEADPGSDARGWRWEEAVLGPPDDRDAAAGRPPPDGPDADACDPGEPEGAGVFAPGDPGPGERVDEEALRPSGDAVVVGNRPPREPRTAANGRDAAAGAAVLPPEPDPGERTEPEPVLRPELDADIAGERVPLRDARAVPGGRAEPGGVGGLVRTAGEPAGDRGAPGAGADEPPVPPAPPEAVAFPGSAHAGSPAARQPALLTDRQMSDLQVAAEAAGPIFPRPVPGAVPAFRARRAGGAVAAREVPRAAGVPGRTGPRLGRPRGRRRGALAGVRLGCEPQARPGERGHQPSGRAADRSPGRWPPAARRGAPAAPAPASPLRGGLGRLRRGDPAGRHPRARGCARRVRGSAPPLRGGVPGGGVLRVAGAVPHGLPPPPARRRAGGRRDRRGDGRPPARRAPAPRGPRAGADR